MIKIAEMIEDFQSKRFEWRYNLLGLLLAKLRIRCKKEKHYFCSEFVAEMLERAEVARFNKSTAHYLPYRLEREIQSWKNLEQIILNPISRNYY